MERSKHFKNRNMDAKVCAARECAVFWKQKMIAQLLLVQIRMKSHSVTFTSFTQSQFPFYVAIQMQTQPKFDVTTSIICMHYREMCEMNNNNITNIVIFQT